MESNQELAHRRFKTLIRLALGAFALACVVGFVGGWMIYDAAPAGSSVYAFELFIPGIVAVVVFCLPIRILRMRWFPTPEALKAAATKP